jgi:streptogramin lyase
MKAIAILPASLVLAGVLSFQACNSTESEDKCPGDTTSLIVILSAPEGVSPEITVTGPGGFVQTVTAVGADTLSGLVAGEYSLSYKRVKVAGEIVGKAYFARIAAPKVTLAACEPRTVTIAYEQEPGSERAYVIEGSGIRAFSAAKLAATGSPAADNTLKAPAGAKNMAFDAWGNLWFSNAEGVYMYAMEDLAKPDAAYRIKLTGSGVMGGGIPGAGPLAFDADGSLWIAQIASDKIVKLTPDQIAATGSPAPGVTITGPSVDGVLALAFDAEGNLWAANGNDEVVRFSKSRLVASSASEADVVIVHKSGPPVIGVYRGPQSLAFDAAGNLWIGYFLGNQLVKLPSAQQAVSDTIQPPAVDLQGSVTVLLESAAIDEAGSVWMPGKVGQVVKVPASGLSVSGDMAASTVLTSPDVAYAKDIAFNPAPAALPLND